MTTHLTPLLVAARMMGGIQALGPLCGLTEKAAYAWQHGSKSRAAGDIPPAYQRRLLSVALARGLPLTADHMIYGATEPELRRLMVQAVPPSGPGDLPGVAAQ